MSDGNFTGNGIRFEWGLAGADGAWFVLYPTRDQGDADVREAKRWLRNNRDVVRITVVRKPS